MYFSWEIYGNPSVDCDEKRFQFEKVTGCEVVDKHRVRFFYEQQYAFALSSIGEDLTLLPSHIYNLADPDNQDHKERFTPLEQGTFINEHQANKNWIGLGPYRVTDWNDGYVEAKRFVDENGNSAYFDPARAGYMDTIRWRVISDDETAMNALINGELDYFERVKSADYFRPAYRKAGVPGELLQGLHVPGPLRLYGLEHVPGAAGGLGGSQGDRPRIRFDRVPREQLPRGLARQVTGPFPYGSPAYDMDVKPLVHDPDLSMDLLGRGGLVRPQRRRHPGQGRGRAQRSPSCTRRATMPPKRWA